MNNKMMIVEDETLMREVLKDYFCDAGYDVDEAPNGLTALELAEQNDYDMILLDITLPEIDGFTVCRAIRRTKDTPIIMVTARNNESDKLSGYEAGADDYVTKPFSPNVLVAKVNALIKRARGCVKGTANEINAADIVINQEAHTVTVCGKYVELTPKEYELLAYLMLNKGKALSRDMLLSRVWGYDYFGDLRTVDTHIKKIRAKLGEKGCCIKTLIKTGYKFDENV